MRRTSSTRDGRAPALRSRRSEARRMLRNFDTGTLLVILAKRMSGGRYPYRPIAQPTASSCCSLTSRHSPRSFSMTRAACSTRSAERDRSASAVVEIARDPFEQVGGRLRAKRGAAEIALHADAENRRSDRRQSGRQYDEPGRLARRPIGSDDQRDDRDGRRGQRRGEQSGAEHVEPVIEPLDLLAARAIVGNLARRFRGRRSIATARPPWPRRGFPTDSPSFAIPPPHTSRSSAGRPVRPRCPGRRGWRCRAISSCASGAIARPAGDSRASAGASAF